MSKRINVQSGHYKVAGRGRQGEDILQEQQKRAYVTQRESMRVAGREQQAGLPAWEVTPPNLETEAPAAETTTPTRKSARRSKRSRSAKRTTRRTKTAAAGRSTRRKTAPARKRTTRRST